MASLIPPRPFGPTLFVRTAAVWLFLHGAMAALPHMMPGTDMMRVPFPRSLVGSPLALLWLTAATTVAVCFEMWRRRELVFLANLGYSPVNLGGLVVAECLLLDVLLRLSVA